LGCIDNKGNGEEEMGGKIPFIDLGTNLKVLDSDSGLFHMCAIMDSYDLKCWGGSEQGQTGYLD